MKFRVQEIELPEGNIYQHDVLNRKPTIDFLDKFLSGVGGPFVLALDSPWGTGKTTFVRMLQASFAAKQTPCIYFNAWKVDYVSDPLVALVAALDEIVPVDAVNQSGFKARMATVKKLTTSVAKHGAVALAKAATLGALNLDPAIEGIAADAAGNVANGLVESFQKEKAALERLRAELEKAVSELISEDEERPLIFFIDELDRCRPSFAIEMLERIKHLFDVDRLVFVLSVDKKQLESSVGAIYGQKIDAPEYLRRFFDLELKLPLPDVQRFTEIQIERFGLKDYFDERGRHHATQYDGEHLVGAIAEMVQIFRLSLRAVERVMSRVVLVCSQTQTNYFLDPVLVAFLVVVRIKNIELFDGIISERMSPQEVMEFVQQQPGGRKFVYSHFGVMLETYLITGDGNRERREKNIQQLKLSVQNKENSEEASHAYAIIEMMNWIPSKGGSRYSFRTASVANKVDLASELSGAF